MAAAISLPEPDAQVDVPEGLAAVDEAAEQVGEADVVPGIQGIGDYPFQFGASGFIGSVEFVVHFFVLYQSIITSDS